MKTSYIKPETTVVELDCNAIICASGSGYTSIFDPIVSGREEEED